jgi:hypothetical protein
LFYSLRLVQRGHPLFGGGAGGAGALVRVQQRRAFMVGALDLALARVGRDAEHFVQVVGIGGCEGAAQREREQKPGPTRLRHVALRRPADGTATALITGMIPRPSAPSVLLTVSALRRDFNHHESGVRASS